MNKWINSKQLSYVTRACNEGEMVVFSVARPPSWDLFANLTIKHARSYHFRLSFIGKFVYFSFYFSLKVISSIIIKWNIDKIIKWFFFSSHFLWDVSIDKLYRVYLSLFLSLSLISHQCNGGESSTSCTIYSKVTGGINCCQGHITQIMWLLMKMIWFVTDLLVQ